MPTNKKPIFVVQEHHARNLHYDFRLEFNGVLKSWAVPKSPPLDEKTKRLAIQVDDHASPYAKFHGEIKEGYGKGTVKIWDKGTFDLKYRDEKKIEVILHGKKMNGAYILLKTNYGKNSWLLMKVKG